MHSLKSAIERLAAARAVERDAEARNVFLDFREQLTHGKIRAAEKINGEWRVNIWVKQGILLGFRIGELTETGAAAGLSFVDKDTFPARRFTNVGAYVDEGTMVDSHALVGSCAQIGKRVHLSAAAQIGGVLEPVNATPVIIEDDVLVGGNCGVFEGTLVRARAVLGAGTILTRSTPLYDIVRGQMYRAAADKPLEVPENAVVVPGSRALKKGHAAEWGLSLYAPVIVKYRDEKTDQRIELEEWLR